MANQITVSINTKEVTMTDIRFTADIVELKQTLISILKENGTSVINDIAPAFKQINVSLGLCDEAESSAIKNWIQAVRQVINDKEATINMAMSEQGLSIDVGEDAIRTLANTIFQA